MYPAGAGHALWRRLTGTTERKSGRGPETGEQLAPELDG